MPAVLALGVAVRYRLGVPDTLIAVLVSAGAPAGAYLAWASYRGKPHAQSEQSLAEVADNLAGAVRRQWDAEARIRRLYDPYAMPVRWDPADASLVDPWEVLVRQTPRRGPGPVKQPADAWAAGPGELAGTDGELVDVLLRVPTGRLVVLGGPGTGKTVLMIRLVRDLLDRRAAGVRVPVPVLVPLASWNPAEQGLRDWLTAELTTTYPALAALAPGFSSDSLAVALLDQGLMMPVLDGLDEIPAKARGQALAKINADLLPGSQLVVTCRRQEYADTVTPDGGTVTLRAAAGIELQPLDATTVENYLAYDAGRAGPDWSPVLAELGTGTPVGRALTTPLMVALARSIYNPREGEYAARLPEPAELCRLTSQEAVEEHLMDAFVRAAYRGSGESRWALDKAERWLVFLARHLQQPPSNADFAWWQLSRAAPSVSARSVAAAMSIGAMLGGVVAVCASLLVEYALGLHSSATAVGYVVGLLVFSTTVVTVAKIAGPMLGFQRPSSGLSFSWDDIPEVFQNGAWGFGVGLVVAGVHPGIDAWRKARGHEAVGAAVRDGLAAGLRAGIPLGIAIGLLAIAISAFLMLEAEPGNLDAAVSPQSVLARDRRATQLPILALTLMVGLSATAAAVFLPAADTRDLHVPPAAAAGYAVALALLCGLGATAYRTAWLDYEMARVWLALRGRLPWALMSFLDDAHQRGVLRQAGATYQFRHIELQRRLASRR